MAKAGNTNAVKAGTGKPMSVYLPITTITTIREMRAVRGESDLSERACIDEARKYAVAGLEDATSTSSKFDQLRYLVSNWQVMANHAEVFAPELLDNDRWLAMKANLEQQSNQAGVTEFIRQVGEKMRERIEQEEDEE